MIGYDVGRRYRVGAVGGSSLLTSLISYWKLNETSNGSAPVTRVDSVVASANDLTDNNTTASAAGLISNAASFVSTNSESLSHATNPSLEVVGTDFTFACWVNLTDLLGFYAPGGKSGGGNTGEWDCFINQTTGVVSFRIFSGGALQRSTNGGAITAAAWHYLVFDYVTATKAMSITIDNGAPTLDTNPGSNPVASGVAFALGTAVGANFFKGLVDEVGFWKRILTGTEKINLWNGGAGLTYPF